MAAPHLPPQTCSIKAHKRLQVLPWVIGMVVIALLSGIATSLVAISWFYPQFIPDATISGIIRTRDAGQVPSVDVQRFVQERTVQIVDTTKQVGGTYYTADAHVADAVLLSSDGWAVLAMPETSRTQTWEAIDSQGRIQSIDTIVPDTKNKVMYVHIGGEGYRVTSFYDWEESIEDQAVIWALNNGEWIVTQTDGAVAQGTAQLFRFGAQTHATALIPALTRGSMLFTNDGLFVGFVSPDNTIVPGWQMAPHLSSVLAGDPIVQTGFTYTGQMIESAIQDDLIRRINGFYVAQSPTRQTSSTIGVGDVIVRINNQPFVKEHIARLVAQAGERVVFTVRRDDISIDIPVDKVPIQ